MFRRNLSLLSSGHENNHLISCFVYFSVKDEGIHLKCQFTCTELDIVETQSILVFEENDILYG
jgi:hypothetical protein